MPEAECPSCGTSFDVIAPQGAADPICLTCDQCGSELEVYIADPSGVATVFQPATLADDLGSPTSPDSVATGVLADNSAGESAGTITRAHLTLESDRDRRQLPLTTAATTVGRDPEADIAVDDPSMSRRHFQIEIRGREFFVRDLQSSNGTRLNDHPIKSAQLEPGDAIRAGDSVFVFHLLDYVTVGDRPGFS